MEFTPRFLENPPGAVHLAVGGTRVICTVSIDNKVPPFLRDEAEGWVTAEYGMLPASTGERMQREATRGRVSGRSVEIQRLIGRSLRSVVDRKVLGERTLWADCDVIQADGGTRTASITGAFVALCHALGSLQDQGAIRGPVLTGTVAAVSVGIVENRPVLDLDYVEDAAAEVDMNVVRTGDGRYVEVQGTAEGTPFPREQLDSLLTLADAGIDELIARQRDAVGGDLLDRLLVPR